MRLSWMPQMLTREMETLSRHLRRVLRLDQGRVEQGRKGHLMSVSPRVRLFGLFCLIGGSLQLCDLPLDVWWSSPTSPVHAVALMIWGLANAALMGGPIGIIAYRFVPPKGTAIAGAGLTLLGNLSQIGGMICYLLLPRSAGGQVLTPLGGILITLGMLVLGMTTLRGKRLPGWQSWTPLLVGLYFLVQLVAI